MEGICAAVIMMIAAVAKLNLQQLSKKRRQMARREQCTALCASLPFSLLDVGRMDAFEVSVGRWVGSRLIGERVDAGPGLR